MMDLCRGDGDRGGDPMTHEVKGMESIGQGALLTQRMPTL